MNQADRKEFDLIHEKIDNISHTVNEMKVDADAQHMMLRTDIKFIKENMFDPHTGLWAESNTYGICLIRDIQRKLKKFLYFY